MRLRPRSLWIFLLPFSLLTPTLGHAEVAGVTLRVLASHAVGDSYVAASGLLSGSFVRQDGSGGTYEVPIDLLYPNESPGCSGIGLEDLANGFFFNDPNLHDDFWNLHFARVVLTDALLMQRGVFYASPTWDKKAIDRLGVGHLQRSEDGRRAVEDTSRLLRDPRTVEVIEAPNGFVPPTCRAEHVIGYGYSDSGSLLRRYFFEGNAGRTFDAGILHAAGATCWDFAVGQAAQHCTELPSDVNGRVMSIDSESDVQLQSGAHARQDGLSQYRHYELAGAAHLPKAEADLMEFAVEAEDEDPVMAALMRTSTFQNPESVGPPLRAFFVHLVHWVDAGGPPPANAYLEGSFDALGNFSIARDPDGNALGGVRMPWLDTVLPDGSTVGAALGTHDGVDALRGFVLGGHYECFSDLRRRYGADRDYVDRVIAGAGHASAQGWILERDRIVFVRKASELDLETLSCPPWPQR